MASQIRAAFRQNLPVLESKLWDPALLDLLFTIVHKMQQSMILACWRTAAPLR